MASNQSQLIGQLQGIIREERQREQAAREAAEQADSTAQLKSHMGLAEHHGSHAEKAARLLTELVLDGDRNRAGDQRRRFILPSLGEYQAAINSTAVHQAALLEGNTGGIIAPPSFHHAFYDRLRARNVVLRSFIERGLTANIIDMDSRAHNLPKIGTSVTAAFVDEAASIPESSTVLEQVTLTPRKLAAFTKASNELLADSRPAARDVLGFDLINTAAGTLDKAFLDGNGTAPSPRGLSNVVGAGGVLLGANGLKITLDHFKAGVDGVLGANGNEDTLVAYMAPRTWGTLTSEKDTQTRYQASPDPTVAARKSLFDVPVYLTNNIPINITVGTSSDTSYVVIADLEQVMVGHRQDVLIAYDPYGEFQTDQTRVRVTSRWDIAALNPLGLYIIDGVRAV